MADAWTQIILAFLVGALAIYAFHLSTRLRRAEVMAQSGEMLVDGVSEPPPRSNLLDLAEGLATIRDRWGNIRQLEQFAHTNFAIGSFVAGALVPFFKEIMRPESDSIDGHRQISDEALASAGCTREEIDRLVRSTGDTLVISYWERGRLADLMSMCMHLEHEILSKVSIGDVFKRGSAEAITAVVLMMIREQGFQSKPPGQRVQQSHSLDRNEVLLRAVAGALCFRRDQFGHRITLGALTRAMTCEGLGEIYAEGLRLAKLRQGHWPDSYRPLVHYVQSLTGSSEGDVALSLIGKSSFQHDEAALQVRHALEMIVSRSREVSVSS